jgi:phosphoribosylformimino-5-aminoimidazole carboxamide ribotide isomerase
LDGVLEGPNINMYEMLIQKFQRINLIASGGVSSLEDLEDLRSLSIKEVIVGKAIYENRISLSDLKNVN